MQKITTCLWFKDQAEQAAKFYTDLTRRGSQRAVQAMLGMRKLDIEALQNAYDCQRPQLNHGSNEPVQRVNHRGPVHLGN